MKARTGAEVEARTQELGRELYRRFQSYRPSTSERLQDWLMGLLIEDHTLRTRLLRFVDVLTALPNDRFGQRTASLFREYFPADGGENLPLVVRLALTVARSPLIPSPLLDWLAQRATRLTASRFIVSPGSDTVNPSIPPFGKGKSPQPPFTKGGLSSFM